MDEQTHKNEQLETFPLTNTLKDLCLNSNNISISGSDSLISCSSSGSFQDVSANKNRVSISLCSSSSESANNSSVILQWRGSSYSPAMTARQAFYRTSSTVRFYLLRFYASEVLLALEYLHMMGVVYRDLKPENVLSCSEPSCRITSYCIQPACIDPACKLPVCVEPACLQPSCFKARFLSTKTSKGDDNRETLFNVVGQSLKFMDGSSISFAAKDLIRGLLVKDPQKRLGFKRGATEIKQHPFFESVNWALIRSTHPPEIPKPIDIPLLNQAFKSSARPNDKGATDSNRSSGLYLDFEFF
ncbi:hypothetical protein V6N13_094078 [Hibiscus sabdariffa]